MARLRSTQLLDSGTEPVGVIAVMVVAFTTVTAVAAMPPIVTLDASIKPVPVMVTNCPPASGPEVAVINATVGTH